MSNATTRFIHIALSSWYHMNVHMLDALACSGTNVDANIEAVGVKLII